jgi:hypothetical protein
MNSKRKLSDEKALLISEKLFVSLVRLSHITEIEGQEILHLVMDPHKDFCGGGFALWKISTSQCLPKKLKEVRVV